MPQVESIVWVDWALLAVLGASLLVGVWRGLVHEVMSLAGWMAAWVAAQWSAPLFAPQLPFDNPDSPLAVGAAFAIVFVLALVAWALLSRVLQLLVQASHLSVADRVLGAGFGMLRGVVLLLALAVVVASTPAAKAAAWQGSRGASWLNSMIQGLAPLLPADVVRILKLSTLGECAPCVASSA